MAAVAMAISGGGALSKYETTVLLSEEETLNAMRLAREIRYIPPGRDSGGGKAYWPRRGAGTGPGGASS
jgi:hypothetical protein